MISDYIFVKKRSTINMWEKHLYKMQKEVFVQIFEFEESTGYSGGKKFSE